MVEDESQEKEERGEKKKWKSIPVGVETKQRFLHFKRQMEAECDEEFSQDDVVVAMLDIIESLESQ